MNINIYSKYRVTKHVHSNYRSYDSDADDFWKEDKFSQELELDGGRIADLISNTLRLSDFQDITIDLLDKDTLKLKITRFNPLNGESDIVMCMIREMREEDNNEKK
jgi:hypothetical protein